MPYCLSIGTNLTLVNSGDSEIPFLNILKQGSTFFVNGGSGDATKMQVDSNGYPTTMVLTDSTTATSFQSNMLSFPSSTLPDGNYYLPSGTYVLLYNGGTAQLNDAATFVQNGGTASDGRTRVLYTVAPNSFGIISLEITAAPCNNIAIVHSPGSDFVAGNPVYGANEQALLNGSIFSPDFYAKVKNYKSFRFMDWQNTLTSVTQNWADRTPVTMYTYALFPHVGGGPPKPQADTYAVGVPVEILCALCNLVGADAHFNMPYQATDSYITSFAQLVLNGPGGLNSNLKCYVEYGNELWNFGYHNSQSFMGTQGATFFPNTSGGDAQEAFGWMRMINTADLWAAVWTGGNASRLIRVGSGQNGNTGPNKYELNYTVSTCTISNGSPAVVSLTGWTGPNLPVGTAIRFSVSAGGSLPSPLTDTNQQYYVLATGITATTFEIATSPGGTAINTTTSGSGTFTVTNTNSTDGTQSAGATVALLTAGSAGSPGNHSWTGMGASHWDVFVTAPYFGQPLPAAWTADSDGGLGKMFTEISVGGLVPLLSPSTASGGTATAITAAPGGLGSPVNGNMFSLQLQAGQAGGTAPTLRVDGGPIVPFVDSDGNAFPTNSFPSGPSAGTYIVCYTTNVASCTVSISRATNANPCVLTIIDTFDQAQSTIVNGATITISGVNGMTQLNGNSYLVTHVDLTTSITINVDSTGFSTYTSGGTATFNGSITASWWMTDGQGTTGGQLQEQFNNFSSDYSYVNGTYGLQLLCYECGQTFVSSNRPVQQRLYLNANRDSRMGTMYTTYFRGLAAINNNNRMHNFADIGQVGNGAFWGALESVQETTSPKYAALQDLVTCPVITSQSPGPRSRRVVHYHHVTGT